MTEPWGWAWMSRRGMLQRATLGRLWRWSHRLWYWLETYRPGGGW